MIRPRLTPGAAIVLLLAACGDDPIRPVNVDIAVTGAQWTQGVQTAGGTIPMVRGQRAAVVNVLLTATAPVNQPVAVALRLHDAAGAVVWEDVETAAAVTVTASFAAPSAQFLVPAAELVAGRWWQVVRDPAGTMPDVDGSTDRWPRIELAPLGTSAVPVLKLHFVPVSLTTHGSITGNVAAGNVAEYLRTLLSVMPVGTLEVTFGAAFPTNASFGTPPSGGDEPFWTQVLGELDAARVAAGSDAHWIGVVAPPDAFNFTFYGGYAYIPSAYGQTGAGTKTSVLVNVGWFIRQTQSRDLVAHELGHNFGRRHAPCGNPSGVDGSFPEPDGTIGAVGHDVYARANGLTTQAGTVSSESGDVMSYCFPMWASPYTYQGAMDFRVTTLAAPLAAGGLPASRLVGEPGGHGSPLPRLRLQAQ